MGADGQQHHIGMEWDKWELPWDDERAAAGDRDDEHNDTAADPVLDEQHRADAGDGNGECGHWDGGADGAVAGTRRERSDYQQWHCRSATVTYARRGELHGICGAGADW